MIFYAYFTYFLADLGDIWYRTLPCNGSD